MPKLTRYAAAIIFCIGILFVAQKADASCFPCGCTVNGDSLTFGNYSPATPTALKVSATPSITCSALLSIAGTAIVSLSTGNSGTFTQRKMLGPSSSPLGYNVFTDSSDQHVFGDGTGGSKTVTVDLGIILLCPSTVNIPIYGVIPAGYSARSGAYSDSLTMTVNY